MLGLILAIIGFVLWVALGIFVIRKAITVFSVSIFGVRTSGKYVRRTDYCFAWGLLIFHLFMDVLEAIARVVA